MKQRTKSVLLFLLDILELYLPMIAFLTIFVCFMIQIVSRYLLHAADVARGARPALLRLGGPPRRAVRQAARVARVLHHDLRQGMATAGKALIRIAGNILLVAAFAISFKPSLDFVIFQGYKKSSVLYIPMNLVSSAYLIFLVDITIRYVIDIVKDIRFLATGRPA